jgi:hypothetical protein
MTSGWEQTKLQELRAKTDRQLLMLVYSELEAALQSDPNSNPDRASRAYVEASRLLPLLQNLSAVERASLETRLELLRDRLCEETCIC